MSTFKNAMKYSLDRIRDAVEVPPTGGSNCPTRAMSRLFVNWLAKKSRRASQYFRRYRFVAPALAATMALALTSELGVKRASADSISCGINEITFTSSGSFFGSSISRDGTHIAFASDNDFTGGNADHAREIFLFDTTANSFTQITNTTNPPLDFGNQVPSVNGDGTRIAFVSNRDLSGGNADGSNEIFLFDTTTNGFTQITNTMLGGNEFPVISDDGTRIAFHSIEDLTGGNADRNLEIFLYDTTTNSIVQVTNTTGGANLFPAINSDGTRIAFVSDRDLTGGNADGNQEIFLFDTTTNSFTQVTNTTGLGIFSQSPTINGDGTRIAFSSIGFPAGNPDGNNEIFLFNSNTGGIAQITFTTGGSNEVPSISSDGTRVAFRSAHDFTGGNADGNDEIFLFDTTTKSLNQVTDTTVPQNGRPLIDGSGTRIAFNSTAFANLGNADGNRDIFLAACLFPPPPPPVTFADLLLSQSADKSTVKQGDRLTYTVTVKNFGPDSAIGAVINDTLSSGVTFVSAQANKGSFAAPPVGQTGTVTWNLGNLQNGDQEAAQIQVTVVIRGKTTITNTATVSSSTNDPNQGSNSSSLTTTVQSGGKK